MSADTNLKVVLYSIELSKVNLCLFINFHECQARGVKMKLILIFGLLFSNLFAVNKDGIPGVAKTHSAQSLGHGKLGLGVLGTISLDNRVIRHPNQGSYEYPTGNLASTSAYPFLSLGLPYIDMSIVLPIYHDDYGYAPGMNDFGLGDLRFKLKLQLPYQADRHVFDVALVLGGELPTADKAKGALYREIDYIQSPSSQDQATVFGLAEPAINATLALTLDFSPVFSAFPFLWHNNIGASKRPTLENRDVFYFSTAFEYRVFTFTTLVGEYRHETLFDSLGFSSEYDNQPSTLNLGLILNTPSGIDLQLGAIMGLNSAYTPVSYNLSGSKTHYEIKTNPPFQAYLGLSWKGWLVAQDDDRDGIPNKRDACPQHPEDYDGFRDLDGCPDPDNDEDGILDLADACPNQPEDFDGFRDTDGCPDYDNDEDGIPDVKDGCPNQPEDLDGYEDFDGCPDFDNDRDGVPDSLDQCPLVAEDLDGFQDTDGCPDLDNDGDGIVDARDNCPMQPENFNGYKDDDGCPDSTSEAKLPEIKNITLKGVQFKTGSAKLTFESYLTLDTLVLQLNASPEVRIEIHGHTDNLGKENKNQILSENRAQAVVNYLVKKNIDATRLKAIGFGESKPLADNKSASGRAQNRRIEMYRVE